MKNLKLLRTNRGLSQQDLANHFHISQQSIYKYEHGIAEPDFAMLMKFADFFNTTTDYLIGYNCNNNDNKTTDDTNHRSITIAPADAREAHHLEMYRSLPENSKRHLDELMESIIEK